MSTDYFQTLRAHVAAGRFFDASDASGPPVVIVNRTFVDHYLPGRNAVGMWAEFKWDIDGKQTIVGVVDDVREGMPDADARPAICIPAEQRPNTWMHVVFILVAVLLVAVSALALLVPAVRATRADPAAVLRAE